MKQLEGPSCQTCPTYYFNITADGPIAPEFLRRVNNPHYKHLAAAALRQTSRLDLWAAYGPALKTLG